MHMNRIHPWSLLYPPMPLILFVTMIRNETAEKQKVHFYACYLVNMHLFICVLSLE